MGEHPIQILLVEDNPIDARVLEVYFRDAANKYQLHLVRSGEAALSFLYHGVEFTNSPRPDVVLLDLHLPEMTGFDVLAAIKNNEHLKDIPVIVLTGSTASDDVQRAYALQANCYLSKPHDAEGFDALMKSIDDFWLQRAMLPKR
ncbi:MAG: response regulator [Planctomycetota bacterium]